VVWIENGHFKNVQNRFLPESLGAKKHTTGIYP